MTNSLDDPSPSKRPRGRPPGRNYICHIHLQLEPDMLTRVDSARGEHESRNALIRFAIDQELRRRERD